MQGIYCLYFETDDQLYYIGLSTDIQKRYNKHISDLKLNKHSNFKLQYLFDKYKQLPVINIIEYVDNSVDLSLREEYWIEKFNSYYDGLNLTKGGEANYGETNPFSLYSNEVYLNIAREIAYSDKTYKEIAEILNVSDRVVSTVATGQSHSWIKYIDNDLYTDLMIMKTLRTNNKYSNEIYVNIFKELVNTNKRLIDIAKDYNISKRIVERIARGESHTYLQELYPEEYKIMLSKINNRRVLATGISQYPTVVSPTGETFTFSNAREFCRIHSLQQANFAKLLKGMAKSHKGWTLE